MVKSGAWRTIALGLVHLALRILALRQWTSASPWVRLDLFSGGCLALDLAHHLLVARLRQTLAPPADTEFFRAWRLHGRVDVHRIMRVLSIAPYAEYGHGPLVPGLAQPALQAAGLLAGTGALAWLIYVDQFLHRRFGDAIARGDILRDGPYRWVRHPRYLGLFAGRIGSALVLASVVAWLAAAVWSALMAARSRGEEDRLRARFPDVYPAYADVTPRFFPRFRARREAVEP